MEVVNAMMPWQDDSELAMVSAWFYNKPGECELSRGLGSRDMRSEAIHRVNAWTFKTHNVPPAVVSTADLTDCIVNYENLTGGHDLDSYRRVQFLFAFAFLRFVNSFADRDVARASALTLSTPNDDMPDSERKATGETSMYAYAANIGMPARFVDLRHRVSHGEVPDLPVLKRTTDEALEWLWHRWWKVKATGDPEPAIQRFQAFKRALGVPVQP